MMDAGEWEALLHGPLEPHDLCVAKLPAARPKDVAYVRALLNAGVVRGEVLLARLDEVEATDEEQRRAVGAAGLAAPGAPLPT